MNWAAWLFALTVGGLISLLALGTVHSGILLRRWVPRQNLLLTWPDNLLRISMIGLCLIVGLTFGPGPALLGWNTGNLPRDLLVGAGGGLVLALLMSLLGPWAVNRWGPSIYSNKILQYLLPTSQLEWAGVLAALLPAAALEELIFRSFALGGLSWLVPPWWLLWPLSLCFGFLHWPQGWWGIVGTTLASVALSLLFLATGSIWAPLAAHYVMNATELVAAHWAGLKPVRGNRE